MRKFIFLLVIFIISSFFIYPVFAENYTNIESKDVLYLSAEESPYIVRNNIILLSFKEIKVDKGVEIYFEENANICFLELACIEGEWLYKKGLSNTTLTFLSDINFKIENGKTDFYYKVMDDNDTILGGGEKAIGLEFDVLDKNYLKVRVKENSSISSHEFTINVEIAEVKEKILETVEIAEPVLFEEINKDDVVGKTDYFEFDIDKVKADNLFSKKQAGKIFLQVEDNGEAWYINPLNNKRYFLGRPRNAFEIMSKLSLGVRHEIIEKTDIYANEFLGKILLDVEDSGRAYYISPATKKASYLGRPIDAFNIMRDFGIGITNENLRRIEIGEI